MAVTLPNGMTLAIASTYGAAINMTAITNATEAVATLAAGHGLVANDVIEVTSGWGFLTGKLAVVKAVSTNDVTLKLINTSSTARYPAGTGTGTVRKINAWTQIQQVLKSSSSGGEQQFFNYQFLESDTQKQIPTSRSAISLSIELADDPTLPGYVAALAASDARAVAGLMATLPNGSVLYYNGYWSVSRTPTMTINEAMAIPASVSLVAEPTRC